MNIQVYFKKPIKYLLTLLLVVCCFTSATAQTTDWFKGSWYGVKNFSHGQIGKKALVRIEIDSQYKDHFSGRLIYMYPKDTIARMIRTFSGKISGKSVSINKSDELYLLDPRSRSFWSNCTQCDENGSFLLNDGELVLKVTTTGCGDSCDAETVFSRNINSYDSVAQADIQKMFGQNKEPVIIALKGSKKKIMSEKTDKKILVDSVKENPGTATASTTKPVNNSGTVAATNVAT
ncbi:MAG: hypothetical protein ABJA35_16730, partial [Parafilimonas sp.]